MRNNFLLLTDAYKITHYNQYPKDIVTVYSYMEPRVGAKYEDIVWCGLQAVLREYRFDEKVVTKEAIEEAEVFCQKVFGYNYFNRAGWEYILEAHNGYLPIAIGALPEGTIVKPGTPVLSVCNTDPRVPWLTNYVESILMHCFAMSNSATISYDCYKVIKKWCDKTGQTVNPFHLNDFGLRGTSSLLSAEYCGIGHLLCFLGTDNLPAIEMAIDYYHADVCGFSVIAAEHSTITSWGQVYEIDAYRHILEGAPEDATVSLVIDSYNWKAAVSDGFCGKLKGIITGRKGKTVLRPDSGIPHLVTRDILKMLWEAYGGSENEDGYKILNPCVGVIYGDGIDAGGIDLILNEAVNAGFAPSNVIFGMGGNLLQNHNRDTNQFTLKCSAVQKAHGWQKIQKTTKGKESKAGMFHLPSVYANGQILREETLEAMRKRVGILV